MVLKSDIKLQGQQYVALKDFIAHHAPSIDTKPRAIAIAKN